MASRALLGVLVSASIALGLAAGCAAPAGPDEEVGDSEGAASTGGAASAGTDLGPITSADEAALRFKAAKCTMCHGMETRVIGPSMREVSERFATRSGSRESKIGKLVTSLRRGSQYNWLTSGVPMPANTELADREARYLAGYIVDMSAADAGAP